MSRAQATALLGVAAVTAAGVIGMIAGPILIMAAHAAVRAAMSLSALRLLRVPESGLSGCRLEVDIRDENGPAVASGALPKPDDGRDQASI